MAATQQGICNQALSHLGYGGASRIGDGTPPGNACATHYEAAILGTFEVADWQFARRNVTLKEIAPVDLAPEWGWEYSYLLPDDFIKLVDRDRKQTDRLGGEIQGRVYGSYIKEPNITYIRRSVEGEFSPLFALMASWHLAFLMAWELRKSEQRESQCWGRFVNYLSEAHTVNAAQRPVRRARARELDRVR